MDQASDPPGAAPLDRGNAARQMADTVALYETRLIRYALHLVHDMDQARDVVQDTFFAFCRADPKTNADREAAWLFTVCRNRALDGLRRERPMDPLDSTIAQNLAAPGPAPSDLAVIRDDHRRALLYMSELPANQQEVLRLKLQGELSYREISQVTGLSESNIGYLIHMAIHTVRDRLRAAEAAVAPSAQGAHP